MNRLQFLKRLIILPAAIVGGVKIASSLHTDLPTEPVTKYTTGGILEFIPTNNNVNYDNSIVGEDFNKMLKETFDYRKGMHWSDGELLQITNNAQNRYNRLTLKGKI